MRLSHVVLLQQPLGLVLEQVQAPEGGRGKAPGGIKKKLCVTHTLISRDNVYLALAAAPVAPLATAAPNLDSMVMCNLELEVKCSKRERESGSGSFVVRSSRGCHKTNGPRDRWSRVH